MSTQPASTFGSLLRRHRRAASLTQEALAERSGVSVDTISALERGVNVSPRKDTIELLADALRLSQEERAQLEAAARGRLAAVPAPTRATPRQMARPNEDQSQPVQADPPSSLTFASPTQPADTPSPPETALPLSSGWKRGRPLSKRVLLRMSVLLVLVVGSYSGLSYWQHLWPFRAGVAPAAASAPGYVYAPPTHKGGTLTFATPSFFIGELPSGTNPWFIDNLNASGLRQALWGYPYVISPTATLLPDELTRIPTLQNGDVSQDGLTVTMRLRPDLRWSDGHRLTADDFVYWLEVELDQHVFSPTPYGFDQMASNQALDAHTLVLRYKKLYGSYLYYLPFAAPRHAWGGIPHQDLIKHEEVNLYPKVTSGPFKLESEVPGLSMTMVPNPYYVSTTLHKSVLDRLVYKAYSTTDTLLDAYEAGEVDYAEGFYFDKPSKFTGVQGLHLSSELGYDQLDFNLTRPVLKDFQVRKAIEEAIDRCGMIQTIFQQPCNRMRIDTLLPAPSPIYDPTIKTYDYNLAQARNDMQVAGWNCSSFPCTRDGRPFPTLKLVTTSEFEVRKQATELIRQNLEALGIPVALEYDPAGLLLFNDFNHGGILTTGQFDLALFAYNYTLDNDANFYSNYHSSQIPSASKPDGSNLERVDDPLIDYALDEGRATLEGAARTQFYKTVQGELIEKVYLVPLFLSLNITLVRINIVNQQNNSFDQGNLWNVGDWFLIK